jgi:hypothetical protein
MSIVPVQDLDLTRVDILDPQRAVQILYQNEVLRVHATPLEHGFLIRGKLLHFH